MFLPEEGGNVAVTGTEDGSLVVWDIILIMEEEGDLNHRREVKSISLFGKAGARNPGVSLLALHGKFLVVGGGYNGTVIGAGMKAERKVELQIEDEHGVALARFALT